jgi:toxin ParE1/3/4
MKLVFSPAAINDLQSIANYTFQTWGAEQESVYLAALWRRLEAIRASPGSHRIRKDLAIHCRSARHEKHVIFFSVDHERIEIIRILHGAMDFESQLPGEPG